MSTSYGLIIENSRNEKLQKYKIILSQHTNYLPKWLVQLNFDMFTAAMFIFYSAGFLNSNLSPLTGCPTWIGFLWKLDTILTELAKDDECRLIRFHVIKQMKSIIFQGCPTKQAAFLPGQPASYNHQFCFFQNAI